jgi:hypothetical protein
LSEDGHGNSRVKSKDLLYHILTRNSELKRDEYF